MGIAINSKSQGSVAKHLRYDGIFNAESEGERTFAELTGTWAWSS